MVQQRPKRPSADATRNKILKAATEMFMQHGFAGTSMPKLAAKAGINQTLIFHHFGDKKGLWRAVKDHVIDSVEVPPVSPEPESLQQFLQQVIHQMTTVQHQCPYFAKLMVWQRLESQDKLSLVGASKKTIGPESWLAPIKHLQKTRQIDPKLKPELLMLWLSGSTDVMAHDDLGLFKSDPLNQKNYINILLNAMTRGLATT